MATAHIIHDFLDFTSTRLGSEVSCPRTLPRKNPEDLVRLEPRTPGFRVKHLSTEPRGTHLFPDIPTRTDKIYHDVIVEDSKPVKQHP